MRRFITGLVLVAMLVTAGAGYATTTSELNDAVLFFVNDPQQLTFTDMNKLVERNEQYQRERGLVSEDQITKFFKHVQTHGVPGAGQGTEKYQVAYVVQNRGPEVSGVIVVKGRFDEAKLHEMFKAHYVEHSNEHAGATTRGNQFAAAHAEKAQNPYVESVVTIDGHQAHVFPMPLQNREMITVAIGDHYLFSSSGRGQRDLLRKTMAVVDGKLPLKPADPNQKVVLTFAPTKAEKKQLEERAMARYDKQRQDSLAKKKFLKKSAERIRQRVIRNKVEFILDSIDNLETGTMTIERAKGEEMTKVATVRATFASADEANDVKKRLMKHMIKEIKRTDNVQDKFAMGNVSITTQGRDTIIRCQLRDSKEQLHAFHLISSYVARGMLDRM